MSGGPSSSSVIVSGGESTRQRQCGRCRLTFAGDPTLHPSAHLGWWLCPACREALLGGGRGRS
jgi:hypothetical protein